MNPVVRRVLFSLAVLMWAGALLYFYSSGRIAKYLAPDFRLIALAGGIGLLVLGLFNLLTANQETDCGHDHADPSHDHESGDMHPVTALLLMVVPLGLSVAWTKDEYSLGALERKGLYDSPSASPPAFMSGLLPPLTREEIARTHRQTEDGYYVFNLMELHFAAGDREMQDALDGPKVETEGRWVEERVRNPNGTRKRLYRLFMTCCAADSRAIPIALEYGATPPEFPEQGWIRVAGTMRYLVEEGMLQPVLFVDRTLAAEPPFEESFLRNMPATHPGR